MDVSQQQSQILKLLWEQGPLTLPELAREVSTENLTRPLIALRRQGWLCRGEDHWFLTEISIQFLRSLS